LFDYAKENGEKRKKRGGGGGLKTCLYIGVDGVELSVQTGQHPLLRQRKKKKKEVRVVDEFAKKNYEIGSEPVEFGWREAKTKIGGGKVLVSLGTCYFHLPTEFSRTSRSSGPGKGGRRAG